jgi:DNA (cytosine-5)-methyltransferase 1
MKYGSVCSGVEAATAAWHPLGWEPKWFSEIEKFPSAVLAHHYPDVPNLGDMTQFKEWSNDPIDLLVGGTPCQSFSVAGLRKGLDDPRGNLMLTYLAIAARYQPKWLVWENVPGVLSSQRGRDFGTFLGALGKLGYGFAYRVLDAQYFGVAQRRRRVFVVGYLGDWRRAAAVLFERESLSRHPAPSREAREEVAKCLTTRTGGAYDADMETLPVEKWPAEIASTLNASFGSKQGLEDQHINGGAPLFVPTTETLPIAFGAQNSSSQGDSVSTQVTPTLDKSKTPAVAFDAYNQTTSDKAAALRTAAGGVYDNTVMTSQVRRLTPTECERLQGFPDNYTQIAWRNKAAEDCPDGPRYKAMGNSMAVPVMRWIGERIKMVEGMK